MLRFFEPFKKGVSERTELLMSRAAENSGRYSVRQIKAEFNLGRLEKTKVSDVTTSSSNPLTQMLTQADDRFLTLVDRVTEGLPETVLIENIGKLGVGPGKIGQILADDPAVPAHVRQLLAPLKSKGVSTRTLKEAQAFADDVFGKGVVRLEGSPSVGTIGEVYQAVLNKNGQKLVAKLPKHGLKEASLDGEKRFVTDLIEQTVKDPAQKEQLKAYIDEMYKGWKLELDFGLEAQAAKELGKNARRFDVAQPVLMGKKSDGVVSGVLYERAHGVELSQLQEMLKVWKDSPTQYFEEFAAVIKEHPWLKNPATWVDELPKRYISSMTEQLLLPTRKTVKRMHGDPHAGNVFINMSPEGQLRPMFIDTGLTVRRQFADISYDISVVMTMVTGNAEGLAKLIAGKLKLPLTSQVDNSVLETLAKRFKTELFDARVSLVDENFAFNKINAILDDMGLKMKEDGAVTLKAQLQMLNVYRDLASLGDGGKKDMILMMLPDVFKGVFASGLHKPLATAKSIAPTIKHVSQKPQESARVLGQFL